MAAQFKMVMDSDLLRPRTSIQISAGFRCVGVAGSDE